MSHTRNTAHQQKWEWLFCCHGCLTHRGSQRLGKGVHNKLLTATAAGLAPATCHHSCMAGHASPAGQDTLCSVHASHILRGRLLPAQDDGLAPSLPALSILCCMMRWNRMQAAGTRQKVLGRISIAPATNELPIHVHPKNQDKSNRCKQHLAEKKEIGLLQESSMPISNNFQLLLSDRRFCMPPIGRGTQQLAHQQ